MINRSEIKSEAHKLLPEYLLLKFSQAIFISAKKFHPLECSVLEGSEFDCYNDASKIEIFLKKLEELVDKNLKV